ncbi:unnamed protein product [Mycena citricolor]|uniref:Major facilitator superfamily (MFS) profile domain-containing protein n=1 Tax=Mycena citricolor TaxID=2018698 RepID=A0AAD2HIF0_9AGAR|nr:unnamed protein product [Mycena citricolor]
MSPTATIVHDGHESSATEKDTTASRGSTSTPPGDTSTPATSGKSRAFYMSFMAIMVTTFLSALDLTAVGTALPTIAAALKDTKGEFTWVGSAYALSSTAFIPLSGSMADAFGRHVRRSCRRISCPSSPCVQEARPVDLYRALRDRKRVGRRSPEHVDDDRSQECALFFRIGGGGILNLTEILIADLVPLAERGLYQGLVGLMWSLASSIGPPIGGALASRGNKAWRWLFFLNLPLTGLAFLLVTIYLNVKTPPGTVKEKLAKVDWLGNAMVIIGSGLVIIGLTWGGIRYPWSSAPVLVTLILGVLFLFAFGVYEATVPERPTIPLDVIGNRTSLSGLLTTAAHGIASLAIIYYLPVFFQACFGASPIRSAVDFLPGALLTAPFALIAGLLIMAGKRYREVNWIGWIFMIVAFGLISTLEATASTSQWVGFQVVGAIGTGLIFSAPVFPILAPLNPDRAGSALALFSFTRSFFQTWGIAIAGSILQNELSRNLPPAFVAQFPPHYEIAYAAIPAIDLLDQPLKSEVQAAFASSMSVIWQVMIGLCGLGFLLSLLMKEVPMSMDVDDSYALEEEKVSDIEKL